MASELAARPCQRTDKYARRFSGRAESRQRARSDVVTLVLTHAQDHALVADCIVPDRFAALTTKEIAALRVTHGGRPAQLGDFFTVTGARSTSVRVAGSLERVEGIGTAMAGGDILIDGAGGPDLGLGMAGGRAGVRGAAGGTGGGARAGAGTGLTCGGV